MKNKYKVTRSPEEAVRTERIERAHHSSELTCNVIDGRNSRLLDTYQDCKLCDVGEDELTQAVIITCYMRATRLFEKIDEAFAGEPFHHKLPADSPESQRRFRAYVVDFTQAMDLFQRTVRLREVVFSPAKGMGSAETRPAEDKKQNEPTE